MVDVKDISKVESQSFELFKTISEMGHEQVLVCNDNETGLKAIIGIHNSTLGPALGGTRMWQYAKDEEALIDVLRLSRGMTFKASITGLNLGGGKAVIIGDARKHKSEAMMRRFGKFVDNLGGKYITAEDVGTTTQDMEWIKAETDHVTGIPESMGGGGDPSPVTAYGTYVGIKASLKALTGSDSAEGKRVIVQGIGTVGFEVVKLLRKENAEVFVYDIYEERIKAAVEELGAKAISADEVYTLKADVYAPCALGATVNEDTIPQMNVSIIAGAANNQLKDEIEDAKRLAARGIIYAPDFAINAGGLINVYSELEGYNREKAYAGTEKIYDTILNIYSHAKAHNITSSEAALELAKKRIREIGNLHKFI